MLRKDARILVTGAHGFLGGHVCGALASRDYEVVPFGHGDCELKNQKQATEVLCDAKPSVIIHLAAECGGIGANQAAPASFAYDNLLMGLNVINAARWVGAKIVLIGTVCSYPKCCVAPFRESDLWGGYPEETNAPYGIAKKALGEVLIAYHRQHGMHGAYLLPANLYGPGDNFDPETSHVIPGLIWRFVGAKQYGRPSVKCWGTGKPTREFLYVTDAADAICRAAEIIEVPGPINLAAGNEIKISRLARMIAEIVGYEGEILWDASRPDGQPRRALDGRLAEELLSWRASTPLEDGLRATVAYYLDTQKVAG